MVVIKDDRSVFNFSWSKGQDGGELLFISFFFVKEETVQSKSSVLDLYQPGHNPFSKLQPIANNRNKTSFRNITLSKHQEANAI